MPHHQTSKNSNRMRQQGFKISHEGGTNWSHSSSVLCGAMCGGKTQQISQAAPFLKQKRLLAKATTMKSPVPMRKLRCTRVGCTCDVAGSFFLRTSSQSSIKCLVSTQLCVTHGHDLSILSLMMSSSLQERHVRRIAANPPEEL